MRGSACHELPASEVTVPFARQSGLQDRGCQSRRVAVAVPIPAVLGAMYRQPTVVAAAAGATERHARDFAVDLADLDRAGLLACLAVEVVDDDRADAHCV